jgi:ornithine decarboxylase
VVLSKQKVLEQATLWSKHLPNVRPYYAVKSNDNHMLMRHLINIFGQGKIGFDCASILEMESVRKISKTVPILYAQPCKTTQDIHNSVRHGIRGTVVDSPEEMEKLGKSSWKSDTFIRLAVPDLNSRQPFSKKFGAPLQWVPEILYLANRYKIKVSGLSFHVGSECENPEQFSHALAICREAMDIAATTKVDIRTIDIGGGFLPSEANISGVAAALYKSQQKHFSKNISAFGKPLEWIAEPGRFMSSPSQILYTPVIGRKRGIPSQDIDAPEFRYTLHESIYGYFSNIPFDGQKPTFELAYRTPHNLPHNVLSRTYRSILFGRTCDGADIIANNIKLPFLNEGDWLKVENMGAYTNVTASEFNGFPKPDMIYDDELK